MATSCQQSQHPWDEFEALKDQSHLYIDQGLRLEHANHKDKAIVMYEKGLEQLDKALEIPIDLPGSTQRSMARLRGIKTKMSRTRQEVIFRLRELKHRAESRAPAPPPDDALPSYEEAVRVGERNGSVATDLPSDAEVIFSLSGGVKIYYIAADGAVSSSNESHALAIYRFKDSSSAAASPPPALLQVGTWVYPLVPGKSPVLQSTPESYMFPDLDDSIAGNAIGIILDAGVSEEDRAFLEALLKSLASGGDRPEEDLSEYDEYITYSNQVAQGLTKGAAVVGRGLVKASVKGGELMQIGTEKVKKRIAPAAENVHVDARLKTGLETAQWASGKAVKVSGFLVSKAGAATLALGRLVAPHIRTGSVKAISHFVEQSDTKSKKQLEVVSELASGSVEAISTVYMALENSSKILARNVADSTVEVVKHRYGALAGAATDNALSTAGNTYLAAYNAAALGPKGLAKRVAKDTSKVAVGVPDDVVRGQIDLAPSTPGPVNEKDQLAVEDTTTQRQNGNR